MVVHKLNTVVWLALSSRNLFHGLRPDMLRWRLRFFWAGLKSITRLQALLHEAVHRRFRQAVQERPEIMGILVWPYIDRRWSFGARVNAIAQHFSLLDGPRRLLNFPANERVELIRVRQVNEHLSLVFDKPLSSLREGQVSLSLLYGGRRIYSVALSLGYDGHTRVAYVGAIQDHGDPGMANIYKLLTQQLHGMQPRDFLIEALRICCRTMRLRCILFVADRHRQPRSSDVHKRTADRLTSYDAVWQDRGATPRHDGFFSLSTKPARRTLESLPPSKQATYRKRYELLDEIANSIGGRFSEAAQAPASVLPDSPFC